MKPIDYRDATWGDIQAALVGLRKDVYDAFVAHGPATTEQLALMTGMSILTLRPRSTELFQMGLIELMPDSKARGGRYRAVPMDVANERFVWRKSHATEQLVLL